MSKFLSACTQCQDDARSTGRRNYLYQDENEYRITSGLPPKRWIFLAYPGGRKVLSSNGAALAKAGKRL